MSFLIAGVYGDKPTTQYMASQIAALNVAKRAYQKEYMEYWNSTSALTGTGRPVDAVIVPCAQFPAARPDTYDYCGKSCPEQCNQCSGEDWNGRKRRTMADCGIALRLYGDFQPARLLDMYLTGYNGG